jgi:aspartate aminotransferase-like enzyme
MSFGTFFLPGPTEVRHEVLAAMTRPMIGHRGAAFEALYADIDAGLRHVFRTTQPVLIATASATGLMEGGVRALPAGPVLSIVHGAFSERFARIAEACGREVEVLNVPWGQAPDPADVERLLARRSFSGVTVVHSETSTSVLSDVRMISGIAAAHGAACVVDSVTGVGGTPLEADAWGLPFVLTGSQKALALPPGLAFAVAQPAFVTEARSAPARGRYLDVVELAQFAPKHQTPNTPALSLLYAAHVQLAAIVAEGIEARWARHAAMAETTWRWVHALAERTGMPFACFAPEGARSHTVTCVQVPPGFPADKLVAAVEARGYVIGGGYGALKSSTFRIGHMGDHTVAGLTACLAVVDEEIEKLL